MAEQRVIPTQCSDPPRQLSLLRGSVKEAIRVANGAFSSKLSRDAFWLVVLNGLSKGFALFGNAYAARCLGPVKLGVSGLVLTTSQQAALMYNGGFDTVAVRRIARDQSKVGDVTSTILSFRLCVALIMAILWLLVVQLTVPSPQRLAWRVGAALLATSAGVVTFAFQGMERLPVQNGISTGSAALTAATYLLFFTPNVFLGADLIVTASAAAVTALVSWGMYRRTVGVWPFGKVKLTAITSLLVESWRYWVLGVVTYFYAVFQIPMIAYLLGPRETGTFRSAYVLAAGVELFFSSINNLVLPRLVSWRSINLQHMWQRQTRLLLVVLLIGTPVAVLLIVAAPLIFKILLGPEFSGAVPVFQILLTSRLVVFVGQSYAWGLVAVGKDTAFMTISVIGALFSVTMNLLLIPVFGIIGTATLSLVSETLVHALCFFTLRRHVVRNTVTGNPAV